MLLFATDKTKVSNFISRLNQTLETNYKAKSDFYNFNFKTSTPKNHSSQAQKADQNEGESLLRSDIDIDKNSNYMESRLRIHKSSMDSDKEDLTISNEDSNLSWKKVNRDTSLHSKIEKAYNFQWEFLTEASTNKFSESENSSQDNEE